MRVHPPKADVLSSTSTSFHPYKCKKSKPKKSNVRSPAAKAKFTRCKLNVTTPLKVRSGNSGLNVNNAETKVNGALRPRVLNHVVTTHQNKRIRTEQPEHKASSCAHPQPTKKEHPDRSVVR